MNQVLIHLKESYLNQVKKLGYDYKINDNEIDVILPDVDYDLSSVIVDPDEQFCDHYGINYDYVNCIELVS